jgi:hypothetical protein
MHIPKAIRLKKPWPPPSDIEKCSSLVRRTVFLAASESSSFALDTEAPS